MPIKSFKFISPGIFINEIDNSQLPKVGAEMGPVIIGRTARGPAMRPVKVNSFSEFVEVFGNPIPGGQGGDIWRDGNYTSPTYAAYAAQAYLRNSNAATIVRLLGADQAALADSADGKAGWQTKNSIGTKVDNSTGLATNGGAYGLFVFASGSGYSGADAAVNGVLAAVWYLATGSITLSGSSRGFSGNDSGSALLYSPSGGEYKAIIKGAASAVSRETSFNFTPSSAKYIRKVFNTNPTLTNSSITDTAQAETYWLGSTYEGHLANVIGAISGDDGTHAAILGLDSGSVANAANFRTPFQAAQTPWFISQDLSAASAFQGENMTKLFKFHTLDAGEDEQKNLKISIADIKASTSVDEPYGSFSVLIRDARDNDNAPVVLERFSSVNLNPNSSRYIGRAVGDQYLTWDDVERTHRVYGNYLNASKFIRVEVNTTVDAGAANPVLLPFGSFGPLRMKSWAYTSGGVGAPSAAPANIWAVGGQGIVQVATASVFLLTGPLTVNDGFAFTGSVYYPAIPLRASASAGDLSNPKNAYFGADTTQNGNNRHDPSYSDAVRMLPLPLSSFALSDSTEYSYMFSLDDVVPSAVGTANAIGVWQSGSRLAGNSWTALSASYTSVLDQGYNRFTVPLHGGFDGLDITEKDPFNNSRALNGSDSTKYAYYSAKRAIDTVSDPEVIEYNLMAMPGIYKESLTSHMVELCESRGDALAVIDLDSGYLSDSEGTTAIAGRIGSVSTAISNLRSRGMNSSYGCAYYPWVQINDTISDSLLWAPPSIVALGTFSSSQRKSELWFAPAGFTRGGLTEGSAGVPVIQTRERLTSKNRDDLYEANVNPIASFPSEGIVIFGQKTLQVTPSALDRINVRRLMIYVKKEISRMAATVLFDQNVPATWNRFMSRAEPFLRSVQARLGLSDFRIILDESTTTADLVDRNVMYAKIFLKPARSIEFIALDFVITNSGAGFED